ncbi:hypothetical protein N836_31180 [Leptolyngbya sp. Heron Island J]|uniref:hypothetical protein n=1 Tax=Leptolyngbya sp. Heron Island J TaxID=1385935 RepID=UPI0003B99339|nr:hypothetical protein [Leptolyngbya sp. Heron Island J]ESA38674.1 hypothetical protein N836_31180 [Leptolyngbya sp. Heron Island J]
MKLSTAALMTVSSLAVVSVVFDAHAQQSDSFTGTVQRVWEDGFRLDTGDRSLRVDSWDLYGDSTASYIMVGDQITVNGEFAGREFDAFSITDSDGNAQVIPDAPSDGNAQVVPAAPQAAGTAFTGTVERVWEDGLQLNTGDRNLRVDAWELCGDFMASHVSVGDRLMVTGEFDAGEFDAFSITNPDGGAVCRQRN